MPRRLAIKGGFTVIDTQQRRLDQHARWLGFADLRDCLQALLDDGWSVPQLATHLDTTQAAIRRAIADHQLRQPSRRQQLARQRQRAAQQRVVTRVAELGFPDARAYLVDRLGTRAWTLEEEAAELGAADSTLRRLLAKHGVRRVAPTRRQRAAAQATSGPKQQAQTVQWLRQARLAELGFTDVDEYLKDRCGGGGAGRCGGCAPSSGSGMAGWTSSWPGLDCDPDRRLSGTAVGVQVGGRT